MLYRSCIGWPVKTFGLGDANNHVIVVESAIDVCYSAGCNATRLLVFDERLCR